MVGIAKRSPPGVDRYDRINILSGKLFYDPLFAGVDIFKDIQGIEYGLISLSFFALLFYKTHGLTRGRNGPIGALDPARISFAIQTECLPKLLFAKLCLLGFGYTFG